MLMFGFVFVAVVMTVAMFATRKMMLGYPCAIFWAILCGHAYNESTATWDIYYFLFFASGGMVIFSVMAMYALREKHDTIGDEEMERGESQQYVDEGEPEKKEFDDYDDRGMAGETSSRTKKVLETARKRREKMAEKYGYGGQ